LDSLLTAAYASCSPVRFHVRVVLVAPTPHKAKEFGLILLVALWDIVHYNTYDKEDYADQYQIENLLVG
jgi:hypothetical protein